MTARLLNQRVKVISAREDHPECQPSEWKSMAFRHLGDTLPLHSTVVVIGDSQTEIEAGRALKQQQNWCDCTLKTIKLISEPKADDLVEQLRIINRLWTGFVRGRGSVEAHMEFS